MTILTEAQRTRQKFFKRLRLYLYAGGAALLCIGVLALLLKAPWFTKMTIVIKGAPADTETAILHDLKLNIVGIRRSALLGFDHYYAWPDDFSYLAQGAATIALEKKLFDKTITFTVTPRQQYLVWCVEYEPKTQPQCSWIDQAGVPFANAPIAEGQLVHTIYASGNVSSIESGLPVVKSDTFAILKTILETVTKFNLSVTRITYRADLSELHIATEEGAAILLSTRFDPAPTALPAIKRLMTKPGLHKLEYINLTVENRAFVKYR